MKKTQLLLAGLLTGTMAFGVACSTDKAARDTRPAPAETMNPGTGGAGEDINAPTRGEDMTPIPAQEGTREMEPEVHETPMGEPPGTGGAGLDDTQMKDAPEPLQRPDGLGQDNELEPMTPNTPSTPAPSDEGLIEDGQR